MKKIQIQIPEPCHEDWFLMTPAEKGRYCKSCEKVVVDFSMMSDSEIISFFQNKSGNICGNFANDQLGRDLYQPTIPARKKYWGFLLSFLITFFGACKSGVERIRGKVISETTQQYNNEMLVGDTVLTPVDENVTVTEKSELPPVVIEPTKGEIAIELIDDVEPDTNKIPQDSLLPQNFIVSGKVMNDQGFALAGATIQVKELNQSVVSVSNGEYRILFTSSGKFTISTSYIGYRNHEISLTATNNQKQDIVLNVAENELTGVVVIGYPVTRGRIVSRCSSAVKGQTIVEKAIDTIKQAFTSEMITVFPNPAMRGSVVNVKIASPSEYIIHLLDNSGKIIQMKEIRTTTKKEVIEVDLPSSLAAGIYAISIIDKKLEKKHSAKLVIR